MSTSERKRQMAVGSVRAVGLALVAVIAGTMLLGAGALADQPVRGAAGSPAAPARICTLSEWNRVDIVARAYCLANDGELSCSADARWRCCRDDGRCLDGGALSSPRPDGRGRSERPSHHAHGVGRGRRDAGAQEGAARRRQRDH